MTNTILSIWSSVHYHFELNVLYQLHHLWMKIYGAHFKLNLSKFITGSAGRRTGRWHARYFRTSLRRWWWNGRNGRIFRHALWRNGRHGWYGRHGGKRRRKTEAGQRRRHATSSQVSRMARGRNNSVLRIWLEVWVIFKRYVTRVINVFISSLSRQSFSRRSLQRKDFEVANEEKCDL